MQFGLASNAIEAMKLEGHHPLFPPTSDFLAFYYEILEIIPVTLQDDEIIFYIIMPLKGTPHQLFHVIKAKSFPMRIEGSPFFEKIILNNDYLIISEDRRFYLVPELQECKKIQHLYICNLQIWYDTYLAPTCLTNLFLRRSDPVATCQREILTEFIPVMIKTQENLIFSVSEKTDVTVQCLERLSNSFTVRKVATLEGAGDLSRLPGCQIENAKFTLPAESRRMGKTINLSNRRQLASALPPEVRSALEHISEEDLRANSQYNRLFGGTIISLVTNQQTKKNGRQIQSAIHPTLKCKHFSQNESPDKKIATQAY